MWRSGCSRCCCFESFRNISFSFFLQLYSASLHSPLLSCKKNRHGKKHFFRRQEGLPTNNIIPFIILTLFFFHRRKFLHETLHDNYRVSLIPKVAKREKGFSPPFLIYYAVADRHFLVPPDVPSFSISPSRVLLLVLQPSHPHLSF